MSGGINRTPTIERREELIRWARSNAMKYTVYVCLDCPFATIGSTLPHELEFNHRMVNGHVHDEPNYSE